MLRHCDMLWNDLRPNDILRVYKICTGFRIKSKLHKYSLYKQTSIQNSQKWTSRRVTSFSRLPERRLHRETRPQRDSLPAPWEAIRGEAKAAICFFMPPRDATATTRLPRRWQRRSRCSLRSHMMEKHYRLNADDSISVCHWMTLRMDLVSWMASH